MIQNITKKKLIPHIINATTSPYVGMINFECVFNDLTNIFVGKNLLLFSDVTNQQGEPIILNGTVKRNETSWYINLSEELTIGNEYVSTLTYYETFLTPLIKDNALVTYSDILKNLQATESEYSQGELISVGKSGIVDGLDKMLLGKYVPFYRKIEDSLTEGYINLRGLDFVTIANIDLNYIPQIFKPFKHTITIDNVDFCLTFELSLHWWNSPTQGFEIKVINFNSSNDLKLAKIILQAKIKYSSVTNFLEIRAKFDLSDVTEPQTDRFYNVYHLTTRDTVFLISPLPNFTNTKTISANIGGVVISDFVLDRNLYSITNEKIILFDDQIFIINNNTDLDTLLTVGKYQAHNITDFGTIGHLPDGVIEKFNLTVEDLNNVSLDNGLIQRLSTVFNVDDEFIIKDFNRVKYGVTSVWSEWKEVANSDNVVNAVDVVEDSQNRFVSDTQITNWNETKTKLDNITWKPNTDTVFGLSLIVSPQIGWKTFVVETNSIWTYDGTEWISKINGSGFVKRGSSNAEILLGGGGSTTIASIINQIPKTYKTIVEYSGVVPYVLDWEINSIYLNNYGKIPNIDVYILTNGTNYSKEDVPITYKMKLVTNENSIYFGQNVLEFATIDNSGLQCMIVIS